ncbi:MAG: flagellar hook-basal body complex protein FliE [Candidatus Latescibacteria bacterium]|nr:flagellar hook-basal body complex protein FliE [Candidatus Latescibacterota bacterium]
MNSSITGIGGKGLQPLKPVDAGKTEKSDESFAGTLKHFVEDVNGLQNKMDNSIEKLATGEITDVHEVMIAVEEANTAMEFMIEIRNKIVEAYQEVMRMPV